MGVFLGIDVGTYGSKAVAVEHSGAIRAAASVEHDLSVPAPGWAEHDAENVWWHDVVVLCREILASSNMAGEVIEAVACSAINPAVLPVDDHGKPLRPAILYGIDTRSTAQVDDMTRNLGEETILQRCGMTLSAQAGGPKIEWLRENEPHIYDKAKRFVTAHTYLGYRLTGRYRVDQYSAKSYAPYYNMIDRTWDGEWAADLIHEQRLADLGWAFDMTGTVTRQAARETGLPTGTPVVIGTADAAAEALSAGCVDPGDLMIMYGSSIFFILVTRSPTPTKPFWTSVFLGPNTAVVAGGMSTGGSLTRWFRDNFGTTLIQSTSSEAYGKLAAAADGVPAGSMGLMALPYFSGERSPIHDPSARGSLVGLTLAHRPAHVYRALLEGVGYGIRHNVETMRAVGLSPKRVVAIGGGVNNAVWMQIVSDILNLPQEIPPVTAGAAYGDAFLAALGTGHFEKLSDIKQWIGQGTTVEPGVNVERYEEYYSVFQGLYPALKNSMHTLADLGQRAG